MIVSSLLALCSLALVGAVQDAQEIFSGMIDQFNKLLIQNHFDNVNVELNFKLPFAFGEVEASALQIGNFSSTALLSTPKVHKSSEFNTSAYFFELKVGWREVSARLDYDLRLFQFLSHRTLKVSDSGNIWKLTGLLVPESDVSCRAVVSNLVLEDLGSFKVSFLPSSIKNWIMNQFANVAVRILQLFFTSIVKNQLQNIIQDYVKSSKLPEIKIDCTNFNLTKYY